MMILRSVRRLGFLRNQTRWLQTEAMGAVKTVEAPIAPTEETPITPTDVQPSTSRKKKQNKIQNKHRIKQGEGDPKLAQRIVDLVEGR
jgi:hypothetical protein